MFLKAGALSLALLLASRLLGLARESAQAAAFGASGLADVMILMITLPDWLVGVLASGALAYVLLPAWARQAPAELANSQRAVARVLLATGAALALGLVAMQTRVVEWLAPGLPLQLGPVAGAALVWSALAVPCALLASLWSTRLQHERDFAGMYTANLVVNIALILAIAGAGLWAKKDPVMWMGPGLVGSMALRLLWLWFRQGRIAPTVAVPASAALELPPARVWTWAVLVSGVPMALPFVARSLASSGGEGSLATFNYAWKLVELPLILAIQLVATLALPAIAHAFAGPGGPAGVHASKAARGAFALAWTLACAAAAGLLVGAPALSQLLFGWGRMDPQALARIGQWGAIAAWGLLPQALIAVAIAILAAQGRLKAAVLAYVVALAVLLAAANWDIADGSTLMRLLNLLFAAVAAVAVAALGPGRRLWLPWRPMAVSLLMLVALAAAEAGGIRAASMLAGLAMAALFATLVIASTWLASSELRQSLR